MADVGHAGADEDFVDLGAGDFGQDLDVVRIVRAGQDRLGDFGLADRQAFANQLERFLARISVTWFMPNVLEQALAIVLGGCKRQNQGTATLL
ncbi:hypothetical protein [Quatrionicoccus australiensis]|uniref:hypothetical protein n=1 Tax=Quatrionicoccus australiensis TaxID=138118 RepID=UPI003850889D